MGYCPSCGEWDLDKSPTYCLKCHFAYKRFCEHLPLNWQKLLGDREGAKPTYSEWQAEQIIKREFAEGKISEAERDRRVRVLAEKIRKEHNPTPQERAEKEAAIQAALAAQAEQYGPSILPTDV